MTHLPAGCRTIGSRLQRVVALVRLPDLTGRVVLVTGGTDGVGRALVEQLATAGATVLLTARTAAKGAAVRDATRVASGNDHVFVIDLDLSSLSSVRAAATDVLARWDRLDLLIANAAHQAAHERTVTADGFEMTFGVNHLGHALLIRLVIDRMAASAPSRVLVVASEAHRRSRGGLDFDDLMLAGGSFRPRLAYSRSKLANILYTRELARHLTGRGVDVNAAHPGAVDTPMMRANFERPGGRLLYRLVRPLLVSADDAAAGLLRVALDPALDGVTGRYFEHGAEKEPNAVALDDAAAHELWAYTQDAVGVEA